MQNSDDSLLKSSDLYKRFQEIRAKILENKWYMSEREGRDVGFDRALINYFAHHHKVSRK